MSASSDPGKVRVVSIHRGACVRSSRNCKEAWSWSWRSAVLCGLLIWPRIEARAAEEQHGLAWNANEQLIYDDNLYRLSTTLLATPGVLGPGRNTTDYVNSLSAGTSGRWTLGRQGVEFALQVEDDQYAHNSSLNHTSGAGNLIWTWRAADRVSGRLGTTYTRTLAAFANTLFYSKDLVGAATYFADGRLEVAQRWALVGGAKEQQISHQNPLRRIDNYREDSGNAGVEYKTASENVVGLDYRYTRGRFNALTALNGAPFNRNYNEDTVSMRVNYALTAKTSAQGDIGILHRSYPNGTVGNVSGDVWHLALQWQPGVKTQLKLSGYRELRAYIDAQSNYFIATGVKLAPTWAPTARIALSLQGSWEDERFIGSTPSTIAVPRRDKAETASANITYTLLRSLQITAAYNLERRSSNQANLAYHDNVASLSFQYSR
jgi:exopolysaccharide biosynthesis operon protein EpsL